MVKTCDIDFRKGTLIDSVSKTVVTLTAGDGGFRKTEKGQAMYFDGTTTVINTNLLSNNILGSNSYVEIWFRTGKSVLTTQYLCFNQRSSGSTFQNLAIGNSLLLGYYANSTGTVDTANLKTTTYLKPFTNYHAVLTRTNTSNLDIYLNSVKEDSVTDGGQSPAAFNMFLSGTSTGASKLEGCILRVKTGNHSPTQLEINSMYEEFLHASPTEKPIRGFEYPKPTDLSSEVDSKVGANLIESSLDFTSGWVGVSATINNSNTFTTTGNGGIYKSVLTVGKKYKIQISGTITGGGTLSFPNIGPTTLTGSFNTVFTGTQGVNSNFYMSIASGNTVTITKLTITEVSGLVAAYNMIPNGNTLVDISGNGNNGTINGALLTKDGMSFNGLNNYIQLKTSVLSNITLSLRFKTSSSSRQSIIAGALDGTCVFINNGVIGSGNAFIAGMATTKNTYKDGLWHSLTVIKTGANTYRFFIDGAEDSGGSDSGYRAATEFQIGVVNNSSIGVTPTLHFDGEISDIRIYNRELTQAEITAYHNSFVKPVLIESFSDYAVGDTL